MRVDQKCECGRLLSQVVSEGTTQVSYECPDCGAIFAIITIYPDWLLLFLQGIRHLREMDYRLASMMFGASYEVFQKAMLAHLLNDRNMPDEFIDVLLFELRLDRSQLAELTSTLVGQKVKPPGAKTRNTAYHQGTVPGKREVEGFAERILSRVEELLNAMIEESTRKEFERIVQDILHQRRHIPRLSEDRRFLYEHYEAFLHLKQSYWPNHDSDNNTQIPL